MYRNVLYYICIATVFLLASCGNIEVRNEEIALEAAKNYYTLLLQGNYKTYIDGTLHGDSIDEDYRKQLLQNAEMFIETQQQEHQGIDSIEAIRATCDTITLQDGSTICTANAFLGISYGDKTKEEIVVPMIKKGDIWYLR